VQCGCWFGSGKREYVATGNTNPGREPLCQKVLHVVENSFSAMILDLFNL
jgi:hypothetical protein